MNEKVKLNQKIIYWNPILNRLLIIPFEHVYLWEDIRPNSNYRIYRHTIRLNIIKNYE